MHKLRNKRHKEILESMTNYIPPYSYIPISKRKMRKFLQINNWNLHKVMEKFKNGDWYYCWPFFDDK